MAFKSEIPQEIIAEIRDRTDIVQIISETVSLKKFGANFKGLCPFHQEKTPSFSINAAKQLFYCFGCQVGGDVISFLKLLTRQSYPEIVRDLAGRYGIDIPEKPLSPVQIQQRDLKQKDIEVMEMMQQFFVQQLKENGQHACQAILDRGYDASLIAQEGLGFSGMGWEDGMLFLQKKAVSMERAMNLGLVKKREQGGYYDRFRNRITFPIRDSKGHTIAFGGRALSADDKAKYLNSPETALYKKKYSLYRLDFAKEAIQKHDFVILTEGYFDALAFVAAGYANVVACCGTAFSKEQAKILKRFTSKVISAFDGDEAGLKATVSAFSALAEFQMNHLVFPLTEKKDPDGIWQIEGKEGIHRALKEAKPILEFILSELLKHSRKGVQSKTMAIRRMAGLIKELKSPIERELYKQKAATAFGIPVEIMSSEYGGKSVAPGLKPAKRTNPKASFLSQEELLIGIMIHLPEYIVQVSRDFLLQGFEDLRLQALAIELKEEYERENKIMVEKHLEQFPQIPSLTVRTSEYIESSKVEKVFQDCIKGLQTKQFFHHRQKLMLELRKAEQTGNHEETQKVLKQLQGSIDEQRERT